MPDAADIEVQAYVKQWGPPAPRLGALILSQDEAFWHLCGKKKAKLSFLAGSKARGRAFRLVLMHRGARRGLWQGPGSLRPAHLGQDVQSANYYYQLVELTFEKSSEPERARRWLAMLTKWL